MLDFFASFRFSPIQRLDFFTVLVQELAVVVCGNQQHSPPLLSQNILIPKSKQQEEMGPTVWESFSFLHFAATFGMAQYVKTTVASMDNPTIVDTSNVNLLITAAYSSVPAMVDFLLQEGWHPNELVTTCGLKSSLKGEKCFVSVWEAFLYRVAGFLSAFCDGKSRTPVWKVRNRERVEHLNDMFSIVESFLQSGADAEVEILVCNGTTYSEQDEEAETLTRPASRVSFSQILQLAQPKNAVALQTLLVKPKRNILVRILGRTTMRNPKSRIELAKYPMATMEYLMKEKWEAKGLVSLAANRVYLEFARTGGFIANSY
ncbi:hypothetical protein CCUS01_02791 [Colletotrichum cuscutae]|uniref:Ankyrin repeat protein n=1 Tax=Colletotrichum cuscutae TaxID=1209917 RepID=A0AAJ0DPG6_9PEZI|nr:hypothetical protein CCUS01_02791 [Colletotrichum cuscutae]